MQSFFDLTFEALTGKVQAWGQPAYRARQIWQAVYRDLAASPDAITTLGKPLRQQLGETLSLASLTPAVTLRSSDQQTRKTLFNLADGRAIETVLMSYDHDGTKSRQTVCISAQAGCALGCVFCATGQMGFQRNLTAGEMVEQVLYYARVLKSEGESLTNVVVMGMGEPFLNYEATLAAIDRLNDAEGFNFGERRITVSTVGLPAMIERFAAERRQVNLAVSLHAATDKLRSRLLPINRQYSLSVLLPAIRHYIELTHRRVTFEWALIKGVNDTSEQALKLADLAAGLLCHVNLIQLNPSQGYAEAGSTREQAEAFKAVLDGRGIPCTIRVRRGIDIHAGCGQLAGRVS
jgi:23S rRNA (adenine2503-C2)-methyltransferase